MTIRVNGVPLPEQAVAFELNRLVSFYSEHLSPRELEAQMDALRRKAREQAVGARLLMEEAAKLGVRVTEEEVEARLRAMVTQAGGKEAFARLMAKQNLTIDAVLTSIRRGRQVDKLVEQITEGVPDPTEAEIRAHFDAHGAEYTKPDRVQAQHILIKPASKKHADRATARARLLEIRRRIEEGADFAEEAAAHSECPSGRKTGGSLGWFSRGSMLPEIDKAVFSMSVGELSDIVETPLGFHLVKKTDTAEGGPAEFEDVSDRIRDFLRHVRRGEAISAHVAELREQAVIEED